MRMTFTQFTKFVCAGALAVLVQSGGGIPTAIAQTTVEPRLVGSWPSFSRGGYPVDVAVAGNHAYLATSADGFRGRTGALQVVDITDPAKPVQVGGYTDSSSPQDTYSSVAVEGNYAYVTDDFVSFMVIDISDPTSPVRVGSYDFSSNEGYGLAVVGDHAFVAVGEAGLQVINISDPTKPELAGGIATGDGFGIKVAANYAFVAAGEAGMEVIDIGNPANPTRVGGYETTGWVCGEVEIADNRAYISVSGVGLQELQVIDISDPTVPVRVGNFETAAWGGKEIVGNYAYIAAFEAGLQVIDVRDPASLKRVGDYDTSGTARSVAVAGNHAFVGIENGEDEDDAGMEVIDISNPANPLLVGIYETRRDIRAITIRGNYAYVNEGNPSLSLIDISDPTNPQRVGAVDFFQDIDFAGDYAFIASFGGFHIVDVSDPVKSCAGGKSRD
ncbi:MAG: hypothetical protein ACI9R3_006093 [Verrucomicrobiales bacterium]